MKHNISQPSNPKTDSMRGFRHGIAAFCGVAMMIVVLPMGLRDDTASASPLTDSGTVHTYAQTGAGVNTLGRQTASPDVSLTKYHVSVNGTDVDAVQYNQKGHNFDIARFASSSRTPVVTVNLPETQINTVNIYPQRYYPSGSYEVSNDKHTLTFKMDKTLISAMVMVNGDATNAAGQPYLAVINDPIEDDAAKPDGTAGDSPDEQAWGYNSASGVLNFQIFAKHYLESGNGTVLPDGTTKVEKQSPIASHATSLWNEGNGSVVGGQHVAGKTSSGEIVPASDKQVLYPNQRKMSEDDATFALQAAFAFIEDKGSILNTLYFPNGTYTYAGLDINNFDGSKVKGGTLNIYADEGALLLNRIQLYKEAQEPAIGIWNSNNIEISGRGIFDGNGVNNYSLKNGDKTGDRNDAYNSQHQAGVMVVQSHDITFNDTYMRGAKQWNWETHTAKDCTFNNIKGLTPYDMSWGDGMDFASGQNLTVNGAVTFGNDDTFASGHYNPGRWFQPDKADLYNKAYGFNTSNPDIQGYDNAVGGYDAFVLSHGVENDAWDTKDSSDIKLNNTLGWSVGAGNGIRLGHEAHGYQLRNYTFNNFNSLGFQGGGNGITVQNNTDIYPRYENVTIKDSSFDTSRVASNFSIQGGEGNSQTVSAVDQKENGYRPNPDGSGGNYSIQRTPIPSVTIDNTCFSNPDAGFSMNNVVSAKINDLCVAGKQVRYSNQARFAKSGSVADLSYTYTGDAEETHAVIQNTVPAFTSPSDTALTAIADKTLSIEVSAEDPDEGDSVTLAAEDLPQSAEFDQKTGKFTWTPTEEEVGDHKLTFTASDEGARSGDYSPTTLSMSIKVVSAKSEVKRQQAQTDISVASWKSDKTADLSTRSFLTVRNASGKGLLGERNTSTSTADAVDVKLSFIQFDLSAFKGEEEPSFAQLQLTLLGRRSGGTRISDDRVIVAPVTDFTKCIDSSISSCPVTGMTWNKRPDFTASKEGSAESGAFDNGSNQVSSNNPTRIDGSKVNVDVTRFVKDALASGKTNIVLAVGGESADDEVYFVNTRGAALGSFGANTEQSPTLEVTVPLPESPASIDTIAVSKQPSATGYVIGQRFDDEGLEITASLSDGTTRVLNSDEYTLEATDANNAQVDLKSPFVTSGNLTVTAALKSDRSKMASFGITVTPKNIPDGLPVTDNVPTYTRFQAISDPGSSNSQYFKPYWYAKDADHAVTGTHIQAHGGQIVTVKEAGKTVYYWYGEDRSNGYDNSPGVHVYRSTDALNWVDKGLALRAVFDKRELTTTTSDSGTYFTNLYGLKADGSAQDNTKAERLFTYLNSNPDQNGDGVKDTLQAIFERPKVLYNSHTGKYVMWWHADGSTSVGSSNYARSLAGVAVSDSPAGPFKMIGAYRLPNRVNYKDGHASAVPGGSRDMTVFQDDDGTAYIIYSSEENRTLYIARLNDDYTNVVNTTSDSANIQDEGLQYSEDGQYPYTLADGKEGAPVSGRDFVIVKDRGLLEAPAMFKHGGKYYIVASGATGWSPNKQSYYTADSILGTWIRGVQADDQYENTAFDKLPEGADGLLSYGDTRGTTFGSQSTNVFQIEPGKFIYMGDRWNAGKADSTYVWLPMTIAENGKLEMRNPASETPQQWGSGWDLSYWNDKGVGAQLWSVTDDGLAGVDFRRGETADLPSSVVVKEGERTRQVGVTWGTSSFDTVGTHTITGTLDPDDTFGAGRTFVRTVTVKAQGGVDATLSGLSVNGTVVEGFSQYRFEYSVDSGVWGADPIVKATATDRNNVTIQTDVNTIRAILTVTPNDGGEPLTYTIHFISTTEGCRAVSAPWKTTSWGNAGAFCEGADGSFNITDASNNGVWTNKDNLSTVWKAEKLDVGGSIETSITSSSPGSNTDPRSGIIIRNDLSASGKASAHGYALLAAGLSGSFFQTDANNNGFIDSESAKTAAAKTSPDRPLYLKLLRTTRTKVEGFYRLSPSDGWVSLGTADISSDADDALDVGVFATANTAKSNYTAIFEDTIVLSSTDPAPVKVKSIAIGVVPEKTEYKKGEVFSAKGLEVTAEMSDGSQKTLAPDEYIIDPVDTAHIGSQKVIVSLKSDQTITASFSIVVKEDVPAGIPEPVESDLVGANHAIDLVQVDYAKPDDSLVLHTGSRNAGRSLRVYLFSKAVRIADDLMVTSDGTVRVTVPSGTSIENHRVVVQFLDDGSLLWDNLNIVSSHTDDGEVNDSANDSGSGSEVKGSAAVPSARLAKTGSSTVPIVGIAVLFAIFGVGFTVYGRRRHM